MPRESWCTLPMVAEMDIETEGVNVGRTNLTYSIWADVKKEVEGVRMKIDGDRFVVTHKWKKDVVTYYLSGYVEYELASKPEFQVCEYYGGEFFVINPVEFQSKTIKLRRGGVEVPFKFNAHPFMAIEDVTKDCFYSGQYDGIMLYAKGVEYRCKWHPTIEIQLDGEVWEVSANREDANFPFHVLRPRPGKIAYSNYAARTSLNAALPGKSIIPFIRTTSKATSTKKTRRGAKCFFINEDSLYLICDGKKPLDLIGGAVEEGEQPLDALVREIREELFLTEEEDVDPTSFLYLGVTTDESDLYLWESHVYVKYLEKTDPWTKMLFEFSVDMKKIMHVVNLRKNEFQPWVYRHLSILESFGGVVGVISLMNLTGQAPLMKRLYFDREATRKRAMEIGFNRLFHQVMLKVGVKSFESALRSLLDPPVLPAVWDVMIHSFKGEYSEKGVKTISYGDDTIKYSVAKSQLPAVPALSKRRLEGRVNSPYPYKVEEKSCSSDPQTDVESPPQSSSEVSPFLRAVVKSAGNVSEAEKASMPSQIIAYPESRLVARDLLREAFKEDRQLLAQDLYAKFSRMGYPGTRAAKVKFMAKCTAWGLVLSINNPNGGGRSFRIEE